MNTVVSNSLNRMVCKIKLQFPTSNANVKKYHGMFALGISW